MRILFSLICFSFLPNQCFLRTISLPSLLLLLLLLMLFLCLNFTQSFLLKHSLSPHSSTRSETAWTSRKLTGTLPFVFSVYGKIWLVRVFVVDTKVFIFYANAGFWSHSSSRFKCSVKKQHLWQCRALLVILVSFFTPTFYLVSRKICLLYWRKSKITLIKSNQPVMQLNKEQWNQKDKALAAVKPKRWRHREGM